MICYTAVQLALVASEIQDHQQDGGGHSMAQHNASLTQQSLADLHTQVTVIGHSSVVSSFCQN